jgi:hypothetical protein
MAGHAILSGCMTEWRHDCPGREGPEPLPVDTPVEAITFGAVICSCPCHRLEREINRLTTERDAVTRLYRDLYAEAEGKAETDFSPFRTGRVVGVRLALIALGVSPDPAERS